MSGGSGRRAVAGALVGLAAGALPTQADRERYRAEFAAELHDLPPLDQVRHAVGVLSQVFALRAALGASSFHGEEHAMTRTARRAPSWRCRLLGAHHWVRHSTEDGGLYEACSECGEDRGPAGLGMMTTPPWPGRR